jgi:hypothetical protein
MSCVHQPASLRTRGSVTASNGSGIHAWNGPPWRPVKASVRCGMVGKLAANARSKRHDLAASRSMFGVRKRALPLAPMWS